MSRLDAAALRHSFGGVRALDGVDLAVQGGEVVGVIGPNGCGKTTLLDVLSGVLRPQAGRVTIDGRDLTRAGAATLARAGLARTFQGTRLLEPVDALSNVMLGLHSTGTWRRAEGHRRARAALQRLDAADLADVPVRELSHGQRRRVELARALVGEPRLLILDEPTAGLFPAHARDLLVVLRETAAAGCAILLVEHDLGVVAAVCDRVVVMRDGAVLDAGPTAAVLAGRTRAVLAHEVSDERLEEVPA